MIKPKIGITVGDINGIGPEIIIKTFNNPELLNMCTPVIYGNSKVFAYYKNTTESDNFQFVNINQNSTIQEGKINMVNTWNEMVNIEIGKVSSESGKCAHISLDACIRGLREGQVEAMVTAPINKKSMHMADFPYPGHTEFLANASGNDALMLLCSDTLRVALVSTHVPLRAVYKDITKERITECIDTLYKTLQVDFGIEKPVIAVLGLNPHAGDDGVMGDEEEKVIRPAIIEAKKAGKLVSGPYAADGFFGSGQYRKFDATLAMYHDQGLVGFKTLSFGEGVNFSAGLNFIRTSPDHGTGFDIAGKNLANPASFRKAIYYAIDFIRNRKMYYEDRVNPLQLSEKESELE